VSVARENHICFLGSIKPHSARLPIFLVAMYLDAAATN
jgi:hypothetical protein